MKAAVLRAFGMALAVEDTPDPVPGQGEILVRVHAVSVNRTIDGAVLAGTWPAPITLPHVPGVDPAGVVEAVGEGVADFTPGDRVVVGSARCGRCAWCARGAEGDCSAARMMGVARWGGMAELVCAPARAAARLPDEVGFENGAFAMRHGALAHHMLAVKAALRPGERVLVTGAAGALGLAAVQIAAAQRANVTAAASDGRAIAALALGARHALNSAAPDFAAALAADGPYDVVIETTGHAPTWGAAFAALGHGGRLVGSAASGAGTVSLDLRRLYTRRLSVRGAALGDAADTAAALTLAARGRLRAVTAACFPLSQAQSAIDRAADRALTGKIFIHPQEHAA